MKAENLLAKLDKVRRTGNGQWTACCPSHNDKSPSLGIRELEDGRVLVHCFGGCSVEEVLGAVGLEFDDLFPDTHENHKPERRPFAAADVLRLISKETLVVVATANSMKTRQLTEKEYQRLVDAVALIQGGMTASGIGGVWK